MRHRSCHCINCIVPPHLLEKLMESKDKDIREAAKNTLLSTARLRGERTVRASLASARGDGRRTIFDCKNSTQLNQAVVIMTENGVLPADPTVKEAYEGLGATREFYKDVFDRNSIDDNGMRLDGYIHYDNAFNNAFFDGSEMVFGDGDGTTFRELAKSIDVVGHELTHGVTASTANLEYHDQSGALNESVSDVFGSLVKQYTLRQTVAQADWLIGADILVPPASGFAQGLRSMKAPGTAYDTPEMGKDPQPDHMSRYVHLPNTPRGDNGGVHINSGIPNKAFYLTAATVGGFAWDAPGHIWYEALKASDSKAQFQDFADTTFAKAGQLYGNGGLEQRAVQGAWRDVGIRITGTAVGAGRGGPAAAARPTREEDSLAALARQIELLSQQIQALTKEVSLMKSRK